MTVRIRFSAVLFAALAVTTPAFAQTTGTAAQAVETTSIENRNVSASEGAVSAQQLRAAMTELDGYDYGKERGFLLVIDEAIRQSAGKEDERRKIANALTKRALDDNLAYGARDLALRRLAEIGKAGQVIRLEKLLTNEDERVAEMARQTIAAIPGERPNAILLRALKTSSGKLREGIINSLGQRRVKGAVKQLKELARQDNTNEAQAAMLALGNIGNGDAGRALLNDIRPPDAVREVWFIALNDAATALAKDNEKLAARLYDRVLQMGGNSPARLAAFKGQALLAEDPEAVALKALDQGDAGIAQVARELLVRGDNPSITTQLVTRMNNVAPDKKVVVVEILGARGDKTVLDAVSQLAFQPAADNPDLQVAALMALENLGDQRSVPMLVKVAAEEKGSVAGAAETTLVQMPLPEVDTELVRLVNEAATPDEQVVAIEASALRKSGGVMEQLVQAAGGEDQKVAIAAFKAMAVLGTDKDFPPALKILTQVRDERVLREGARVLAALAKHFQKPEDAVTQVQAAYAASDNNEVKASLLDVLGKLGGPKALETIQQNLASEDENLQDTAVRALANFQDASALDDLMRISAEGSSDVHKVLALRGAARLLGAPSAKTTAERLETTSRALALAIDAGPQETKTIIGALADVKVPGVLTLILPFIDQPEYKEESAAAIIKQAPIANAFDPKTTAEQLNPLKDKLTTDQWDNLEKALTPSETGEKAIRAYQGSTTYTIDDNSSVSALLQQQFEPETGGGEWPMAVWAGVDDGDDNLGKADLRQYYADNSNVAAYLRFHVWSPDDRTVRLDTGSDDGLRAWVNGTQVFAFDDPRGHTWWGDKTNIDLKRGWNSVMLKIGQGDVAWDVAARIVDNDGKPVPGLKYSALPQAE